MFDYMVQKISKTSFPQANGLSISIKYKVSFTYVFRFLSKMLSASRLGLGVKLNKRVPWANVYST